MSDSALEREIEAALNVDPSPEFLARVRSRIASEPVPAAWRFSWAGLATAAAAAVVAAAAVAVLWTMSRDSRQGGAPPVLVEAPSPVAPSPVPQRTTPLPAATADPAPATPAYAATRRARRVAPPDVTGAAATPAGGVRTIADGPPFAEVLVSEDEVRAFQKLIAAVGGVRAAPPPGEGTTGEPVTLPPVEIAPVIIEPPARIARVEIGEGQ